MKGEGGKGGGMGCCSAEGGAIVRVGEGGTRRGEG